MGNAGALAPPAKCSRQGLPGDHWNECLDGKRIHFPHAALIAQSLPGQRLQCTLPADAGARQRVNKELGWLGEQGVVQSRYRRLKILDVEALRGYPAGRLAACVALHECAGWLAWGRIRE